MSRIVFESDSPPMCATANRWALPEAKPLQERPAPEHVELSDRLHYSGGVSYVLQHHRFTFGGIRPIALIDGSIPIFMYRIHQLSATSLPNMRLPLNAPVAQCLAK